MKESSKGKLSDRAILLEVMPTGTVLLEVALATQVSYCYCNYICLYVHGVIIYII